jgi:hypothetical protein
MTFETEEVLVQSKAFLVAFASSKADRVLEKIQELGESVRLLPGLYAVVSGKSDSEIMFALDPLIDGPGNGIFIIQTTHVLWRSMIPVERDDALKRILASHI